MARSLRVCGVVLAALLLLGAGDPPDPEHLYVGAAKCKTCHKKELIGNQYGVWLEGPHARAYQTLASAQSRAIAAERGLGAPQEAEACLSCHVTAHAVAPVHIANRLEPADGVQCESCHGPGRDYRKKKIMSDREKAVAKGLWDAAQDDAICTRCHNAESPTFDPKRYMLGDGTHAGFDFEQAKTRIPHAIPEDVKGRFLELEEEQKRAEKAAAGG